MSVVEIHTGQDRSSAPPVESQPSRVTVGGELPARMSAADMMREFKMRPSTFYKHLQARAFDRFEILPRIGPRAWSGALVKSYFDGHRQASRLFGNKRV